jgi:hypothetical protein
MRRSRPYCSDGPEQSKELRDGLRIPTSRIQKEFMFSTVERDNLVVMVPERASFGGHYNVFFTWPFRLLL